MDLKAREFRLVRIHDQKYVPLNKITSVVVGGHETAARIQIVCEQEQHVLKICKNFRLAEQLLEMVALEMATNDNPIIDLRHLRNA